MSTINIKHLSRGDWLALRRQYIGGSDAAAILGLNPYKSATAVWLEKTSNVVEEVNSPAVLWGTNLEPVILEHFKTLHKGEVVKPDVMFISDQHPFMSANLDGLLRKEDGSLEGIEIKTASSYNKDFWKDERAPLQYTIQCCHYMAVVPEITKFHLIVLIGGQDYRELIIERDEELIDLLIVREKDFWQSYIMTNQCPLFDGSFSSDNVIKTLYPTANGEEISLIGDGEVETAADSYQILTHQIETLEVQLDDLKKQRAACQQLICNKLGAAEKGQTSDFMFFWKNVRRPAHTVKESNYRKFYIKRRNSND